MMSRPLLALALTGLALPAAAQTLPDLDKRVTRLEREVTRVSKRVLPKGEQAMIEPEIGPAVIPAAPPPPPPASAASVSELADRVGAIEGRQRELTAQIEEQGNRLKQLEERLAKFQPDAEARLGKLEAGAPAAPAPPPAADPAPMPEGAFVPKGAGPKGKVAAGADADEAPNPVITSADVRYKAAYKFVEAKDWGHAAPALQAFIDQYPKHKLASNARYWLGRTQYAQLKYDAAARTQFDNYKLDPKGDRAQESLFWVAQSLVKLKKTKQACQVYDLADKVYADTKTLKPELGPQLSRHASARAVPPRPPLNRQPDPGLGAAALAAIGDTPVAVAISGGPDSMALLWLAAHAYPGRVNALTVDHRLRPESAVEAAMVAETCAWLGVPHATLVWRGLKPRAGRPAAARTARYQLMRDWCARAGVCWLLTAHHADDQAETVLMRLARGAGTQGLAGIAPARPLGRGVTLLRPLLHARKADLVALCAAHGLPAANDPTNRDPTYTRTAARALLAATPWLNPASLAASAANLADAEAALAWAAERAWAGGAELGAKTVTVDAEDLPRAFRLRLLARALATIAPGRPPPRGPDLARLLDALDRGETATLAGVHAHPGPPWRFAAEPPRRA